MSMETKGAFIKDVPAQGASTVGSKLTRTSTKLL